MSSTGLATQPLIQYVFATNPANSAAGKVVVITGGGIGVGRGIAGAFVDAGAKAVVIIGRRENILLEAKKELSSRGTSTILSYVADVVDEPALNFAFTSIAKEVGPIDIVVANAGFCPTTAPLMQSDFTDWWKTFDINIRGTALTFRAFLPHKSSNAPAFIAVNTAAAHIGPLPSLSAYHASKLGLAGFVITLQGEHPDIRITNFHPGVIETDMFRKTSMPLILDDISLPSGFAVWLASPAADFVGGKFFWAHWDVEDLARMKENIAKSNELTMRLEGWPKEVEEIKVVA